MSSFEGQTTEYTYLSIDRFDEKNLKNGTFFLSHNHEDHTRGLFSDKFILHLQSQHAIKLYCSEVTRALLLLDKRLKPYLRKCPSVKESIISLPTVQPTEVNIIDADSGQTKDTVTVTLFPAGHCPGSVMFLYEGSAGTVLYTGDFRIRPEEYSSFDHLLSKKSINSMYLDTTFCVPNMKTIPSRQESAQTVIDIIDKWIKRGPEYVVHLAHKTYLGYEQLYTEVSSKCNTKIHINESRYKNYKHVGNMQSYTTPNSQDTKIHACTVPKGTLSKHDREHHLPCAYTSPNGSQLNVCTIQVSTLEFALNALVDTTLKHKGDNFYRVLYSFHSSYSEIYSLIKHLKPDKAVPNVIPKDCSREEIETRVNKFVESAKKYNICPVLQETRPLGQMKPSKTCKKRFVSSQNSDELQLFSDDDSPVKKKLKSSLSSEIKTMEDKASVSTSEKSVAEPVFKSLFDNSSDSDGGAENVVDGKTKVKVKRSEKPLSDEDMYDENSDILSEDEVILRNAATTAKKNSDIDSDFSFSCGDSDYSSDLDQDIESDRSTGANAEKMCISPAKVDEDKGNEDKGNHLCSQTDSVNNKAGKYPGDCEEETDQMKLSTSPVDLAKKKKVPTATLR